MKPKINFRFPVIAVAVWRKRKRGRPLFASEYFSLSPDADGYMPELEKGQAFEFEVFSMASEAWWQYRTRNRKSKGDEHQTKAWVRNVFQHLRAAWQAYHTQNDLLAKYEFRTAETYWLRLGMDRLSSIAGEAWLLQMKRKSDGRNSAARRWGKNKKELTKRDGEIASLVEKGITIADIAERYGVGVRRAQQIIQKTKTK